MSAVLSLEFRAVGNKLTETFDDEDSAFERVRKLAAEMGCLVDSSPNDVRTRGWIARDTPSTTCDLVSRFVVDPLGSDRSCAVLTVTSEETDHSFSEIFPSEDSAVERVQSIAAEMAGRALFSRAVPGTHGSLLRRSWDGFAFIADFGIELRD
jgi:hypothetical protein